MFELTFLGTAAGVPSIERGLPALLVQARHRRFLVDCGEGTQRQLLKSGLGFRRLERVLFTHAHLDHVLGLGGLVGTLALLDASEGLIVHGDADTLRVVRHLIGEVVWPGFRPPLPITLIELLPGVVLDDDDLRVSAFRVRHREAKGFGFRFEEKPRRPMLPERLDALGVPAGPERRRLVRGETIALPDGRRVTPDEVLAEARPGTVLVVIGDAGDAAQLLPHVRNADTLVIEATFLERDADKARARGHLTAAQAARLAGEAGVGMLWLTHISPRYAHEEVQAEAGAIFPGAQVARDFDRVTVRRRPDPAGASTDGPRSG